MLSKEYLETVGVFDWSVMVDTFDISDILIGNGFSINLWQHLNYKSLCEMFCSSSSKELVQLFDEFKTTNFEQLLDALNNTQSVNKVLKSVNPALPKLQRELKEGLIKTIQATHPQAKDIRDELLRSLAKELEPFQDIYTTNYDVYLYKIILASNFLVELKKESFPEFGDGFYEDISAGKVGFGDFDFKERNLVYLHGSLFIFNQNGNTYKLRKIDGSVEYIRLIQIELDNDNFPVYVAEGTAENKYLAINDNYYLRSALNRFKQRSGDLIVYGFSFGKSDAHIVGAINSSKTKNIVVSIYPNKSPKELEIEISRINNLFPNKSVQFFDSRTMFTFDYPKHFY
ncbi:DUF4917 family protein [Pedobacter agri]|uniref:DUF4917 family protein n=1 Tax=Pedobacter agri TaxID=454586 RepID=UPI00277D8817|nr:DUF4917 family protein [Pedobacter agri]MDQ1139453.1 hypothetical protein [Pedobacter agri]